ncbi:MAG: hypothetical protein AAGJ18_04415, partial [Bacteroidota bacterium]
GAAYFLLSKEDTKTTILTKERNFAVPNIDQVHKVFIANRNGESVTLERKPNHWQLNGKYRANPNPVQILLNTIQKVKIKYTPANAATQNIINDIATNNIKVEIYDKNNQPLSVYYVGGTTNDELGTHMIKEGAETPFVTYLPGFEGGLRVRYSPRERDWRDKAIFREQLQAIESVSVEYPKQKNKSFKIERENGTFSLKPFYENTPKAKKPTPSGQIERYLIGYERLIAESFSNEYEHKDSIKQLLPFSIIRLKTKGEPQKVVRLHPIIKRAKNGQMILDDSGTAIIEKYFADVNGEDFMLIQQLIFGKILWSYDSFFL